MFKDTQQKTCCGKSAKRYDYLVVGAGLFGAIFAYEKAKSGKKSACR